jgi:hypothetical protein
MTRHDGLGTVRRRWMRLTSALLLAVSTTACGDKEGATAPEVDGVTVREVILQSSDGTVAFSHQDHWHGSPVVRANGTVGINLRFTAIRPAPDDHDAPAVETWFSLAAAPAEYNVRVVVEDTTIARWTGDRVSGTLHGLREGASRLSVVVRRGTTTLYEAPPLNFRVQAAQP